MWVHNLNPIALSLGPVKIHWYGIMYVLSFIFIYYYLKKQSKHEGLDLNEDQIDSIMIWITVGLLVGARVFQVLVWQPAYYFSNPTEILMIWKGGLSFHGGMVGAIIAAAIIFRKYKLNFLHMADLMVVPLALAQALGRLGNFINGELYGRVTEVWWAMQFPGASGWRHPSQLYELSYNLVLFGILFSLRNRKASKHWPHGMLLCVFLILYPIFRFLTEYVREPTSAMIGTLTMGQFLNVFMFLGGVILLKYLRAHSKNQKD